MKIVFAGSPELAAIQLAALLKTNHEICAVYTKPDRPAGRGKQLAASPVKQLAIAAGLPVYQPKTLKTREAEAEFAALKPDLMIVVAYGLILPKAILDTPRFGGVNLHFSLLPRWRGAAPIQRAILAGDNETGITLMKMDEGLDTGKILYQRACPIFPSDTAGRLQDRLADLGVEILEATMDHLPSLEARIQNEDEASYAHKILKEEGRIDWRQSALELDRKIRAFSPWPVAFMEYQGQTLRLWQAEILSDAPSAAVPGTVLSVSKKGLEIATGKGILSVTELQFPGKKVMTVAEALNGKLLKVS